MLERMIIAGAGGQGVVLMGKLLASVVIDSVPHVTFFPAYGAEVRGGTSNCQIILSSDRISSPVSEEFDTMVIMNQASMDKFLPELAENGTIFINSSLCDVPPDLDCVRVDATDLAVKIGNAKTSNLVMLGALIARKQLAAPADIESAIKSAMAQKGGKLTELNVKAFKRGLEIGGERC